MSDEAIDARAFRALSCGVYIVSANGKGTMASCIVNTLTQVTATPARVSVAVNKDNFTAGAIDDAGRFEASVLAESAPLELIGRFGFHTSADTDKFAETEHAVDAAGMPYVTEHTVAHIGARVIGKVDVGTHYLFIGEVESAEALSDEAPMTYAYYHQVKGGKTPPKASSYDPVADRADGSGRAPDGEPGTEHISGTRDGAGRSGATRYGWKCLLCGYVYEVDELPEDFTCPMCGAPRDMFERIEL